MLLNFVVVNSIGGLVWNDKSTLNDEYSVALCRFMLYLRNLLRHSLAVCILTVPNDVANNPDLFAKAAHLADYAFVIDDSTKTSSRLTHTQYDGLFRIAKLPRLNSLNPCFVPETLDLAFYMKKKRLIVEQLHLPPDLGENDDTQKGRTGSSVTISCSSGGSGSSTSTGNSKLDF
jgi:elongator complex protein 4